MKKSRLCVLFFACIITQYFAASQVFADRIILSGDMNIAQRVGNCAGVPVNPNSETWFTNILGSGSTVKI